MRLSTFIPEVLYPDRTNACRSCGKRSKKIKDLHNIERCSKCGTPTLTAVERMEAK